MIDRAEILAVATDLSLAPDVVEKDYVLGWLLAGINAHDKLALAWAFKGGTCLKKCYFETYRFSEDLDFTISDLSHLGIYANYAHGFMDASISDRRSSPIVNVVEEENIGCRSVTDLILLEYFAFW